MTELELRNKMFQVKLALEILNFQENGLYSKEAYKQKEEYEKLKKQLGKLKFQNIQEAQNERR